MAKGLTGLAHIGVKVSDMQRSLRFYVNDLGFELCNFYERPNGTELAFVQAGTCIVELIHSPESDLGAVGAGIIDHFCLECDDIDAYLAGLEGKVKPLNPVGDMPDMLGGVRNVFFEGPDGERIELFQFMSKQAHI